MHVANASQFPLLSVELVLERHASLSSLASRSRASASPTTTVPFPPLCVTDRADAAISLPCSMATTPGSTATTHGSDAKTAGSTATTPGSTATTPGSTATAPGSTATTPGATDPILGIIIVPTDMMTNSTMKQP